MTHDVCRFPHKTHTLLESIHSIRHDTKVQLMRSSDVTVVFAAMSPGMEKLLTSHGVIRTAGGRDGDCDEADIVIDTADGALGAQ